MNESTYKAFGDEIVKAWNDFDDYLKLFAMRAS